MPLTRFNGRGRRGGVAHLRSAIRESTTCCGASFTETVAFCGWRRVAPGALSFQESHPQRRFSGNPDQRDFTHMYKCALKLISFQKKAWASVLDHHARIQGIIDATTFLPARFTRPPGSPSPLLSYLIKRRLFVAVGGVLLGGFPNMGDSVCTDHPPLQRSQTGPVW